jgi:quercetin dioxygenase-like cupin family protein
MPRKLHHWASIAVVGCLTMSAMILAAQGRDQAPPPPAPKAAQPGHVMTDAAQLKFTAGPPSLPPGSEMAVLDGDPTKPGMFTLRVKLPDGYTVPPHWHPTAENLVILSGTLMMGVGDKMDDASMHALGAGGYAKMPAKTRHYVRAKGETTFQVYGTGPFAVTYVNPKDDPRKKTTP